VIIRDDAVYALDPNLEVIRRGSDGALVRTSKSTLAITIPCDDLLSIIAQVDGVRPIRDVVSALSTSYDRDKVLTVLDAVAGEVHRERLLEDPTGLRPIAGGRVLIVGNGTLATLLLAACREAGWIVELLVPASFESSAGTEPLTARRPKVQPPRRPAPSPETTHLDTISVAELSRRVQDWPVTVCALEDVAHRAILDVDDACAQAGTTCLHVTPTFAGHILLGPTMVAGAGVCFECMLISTLVPSEPELRESLALLRAATVAEVPHHDLVQAAVVSTLAELARVVHPTGVPRYLASIDDLGQGGVRQPSVVGAATCARCARRLVAAAFRNALGADDRTGLADVAEIAFAYSRMTASPARADEAAYRRVAILGGGTAGYLTALTFRKFHPEVDVTLIDTTSIPVIGVGEATTSELPPFLHRILGLDVGELYREVEPTFKLGIKFEWGRPAPHHFHYPFDVGRPLEAWLYDGHLREASLLSMLMERGRGPIIKCVEGRHVSLLSKTPYAYHLDNQRFITYLKAQARRAGVEHLDAKITDATMLADGETIDALVAEDGSLLRFDLYVDCSGFRSFLLEKKLGCPFLPYDTSLFTDSAVVANVPHGGEIKPFTTAETMDAGWCWNIPQIDCDHRGYVFSSAFCSIEQAVAEMRRKNPHMGDFWSVRFRSGRHAHFFKGNVVAIGNAYGFVEPLESTAIQVIIHQNLLLASYLPRVKEDTLHRAELNEKVARLWDYLRWFLAIHYKFNDRLTTPFWEACRRGVDISGAEPILEQYRLHAPLIDSALSLTREQTFNAFGYDVLLFGQGVTPTSHGRPRDDEAAYRRRCEAGRLLAERALSHAATLEMIREHPELLEEAAGRGGWMGVFEAQLRGDLS
jgi:tryptophan halogenase